jgi:hypothetical protein
VERAVLVAWLSGRQLFGVLDEAHRWAMYEYEMNIIVIFSAVMLILHD